MSVLSESNFSYVLNASITKYSLWSSAIILLVLAMIVVDMMVGFSFFIFDKYIFILMIFILFINVLWILNERPVCTFDTEMLSL